MTARRERPAIAVALFAAMYACMTIDRSIMGVLVEPIRAQYRLNDVQLGLLSSFAFAICFGLAGIPFGILADRINRKRLLVACLIAWSLLTNLCALAGSFGQLLAARIGVGIGEAGGTPTAVSMLADFYPKERRATAVSMLYLGGPVGTVLVFAGGAYVANVFGWRTAFIMAGLPGILLALLIAVIVTEPPRGRFDPPSLPGDIGLKAAIGELLSVRSLRFVTIGITLCALVLSAELMWLTSFLMRSHGLSLTQAGLLIAIGYGVVSAVGVAGGGLLTDRLARRGVLPTATLTAASIGAAAALVFLLTSPTIGLVLAGLALWSILASTWYGPAYGLCQNLVSPQMRAKLSSIIYFLTGVISFALGPQIVGFASDLMRPQLGEGSLRFALLIPVLGHVLAALAFWRAGWSVKADLARLHRR